EHARWPAVALGVLLPGGAWPAPLLARLLGPLAGLGDLSDLATTIEAEDGLLEETVRGSGRPTNRRRSDDMRRRGEQDEEAVSGDDEGMSTTKKVAAGAAIVRCGDPGSGRGCQEG